MAAVSVALLLMATMAAGWPGGRPCWSRSPEAPDGGRHGLAGGRMVAMLLMDSRTVLMVSLLAVVVAVLLMASRAAVIESTTAVLVGTLPMAASGCSGLHGGLADRVASDGLDGGRVGPMVAMLVAMLPMAPIAA